MKTSEKILAYIAKNGQTTGNELIDHLDLTDRAIRKQLRSLLDEGKLVKSGVPPKVYYSIAQDATAASLVEKWPEDISANVTKLIEAEFYFISPRGTIQQGIQGFMLWCKDRKLDIRKTAERYYKTVQEYGKYRKRGLIDGTSKLKSSFDDVALDKLFYIDFYSIEIFGKTKLGQLLLFAKQSQNRKLMNELATAVQPSILGVIRAYDIDGVGFIPPTVKRELQLMKQLQSRLNLQVKSLSIVKVKTPVAVPQKTLAKLEDRIINARETITVEDTGTYNNILLIDDAVGSGSTLNETAKKIRQKGICKGRIIGLAITGSFKGFEIISEV